MPKVSGQYNLPPGYLATSGTTIQSSQHNTPLEDIAQALTGDLPRDGSAAMTGNFNMGSQRITNLATGTQPSDAARVDQLASSDGNLSSLSGLDFQVNRGIYTTAANTAALYTLTPLARTFSAQSTTAGQRSVMELGTAAVADLTDNDDLSVSPNDVPTRGNVEAYVDAASIGVSQSLVAQYKTASATSGAATTASTWTKYPLSAMTSDVTGATLTSSVISLPAGDYEVTGSIGLYQSNSFTSRLRDTTNSANLALGTAGRAGTTDITMGNSFIMGRFTLAGTTNIEVQYYVVASNANGLGIAVSSGSENVFGEIRIEKL